jgi:hypothetical protein
MTENERLNKLFETALENEKDPEINEAIKKVFKGTDSIKFESKLLDEEEKLDVKETENIQALIADMKLPQKIKLALLGGQSVRTLLIRDTNKSIPLFVLQNPKITENEIIEAARNINLDEGVHRMIANDSNWSKLYPIRLALVSNPKVPVGISLRFLNHIQDKDLRRLTKSKNIPQVISAQSKKLLAKRGKY